MAVAYDAASESHTGTTGSASEGSFSWTHAPSGTPRGILVFTFNASSTTDTATAVTWGGKSLTAVSGGRATDSAGEPGDCKAWFLGSALDTRSGNTVQVTRTNNADVLYAVAVTVTAASDTATHDAGIVLLQGDGTFAEQSVTDGSPGTNSLRFAGAFTGLSAINLGTTTTSANTLVLGTSSTNISMSIDLGSFVAGVVRETTAGQGARSVGFQSSTSDDRAAVHLAIKETGSTVHSPTFSETAASADAFSAQVIGLGGWPGPGLFGLNLGVAAQEAAFAESASTGDSASATLTQAAAFSESAASGDSVSNTLVTIGAFTESAASGDSVSNTLVTGAAFAESAASGDSVDATRTQAAAFDESAASGDSVDATKAQAAAFAESAASSDSTSNTLVTVAAFDESAASGESFDGALGGASEFSESAATSDSVSNTLVTIGAFSESAASGDSVDATKVTLSAFSESAASADSFDAATGLAGGGGPGLSLLLGLLDSSNSIFIETAATSDSFSATKVTGSAFSESAASSDSFDGDLPGQTSHDAATGDSWDAEIVPGDGSSQFSESASATDSVTNTLVTGGAFSESASTTDSVNAAGVYPVAFSESAASDDSVASTRTQTDAVAESSAAADAFVADIVRAAAFADSSAASDAFDAEISGTSAQFAESSVASDAVNATLQFLGDIAESVAAAESFTASIIRVAMPVSDAETGGWQSSAGGALFDALNDRSDDDYIYTNAASICSINFPVTANQRVVGGRTVYYRIAGDGSSTMTARLKQGESLIASWSHSPAPGTLTTFEQKLSAEQEATISPNSASVLRLEFEAV